MGAFLSWEQIFEAIQKCWGSDADFEDLLTWFYVEKWTPDGNGRLKNNYSYEVIGGKVCYCCCEDLSVHERLNLGGYTDPNMPVPFHAGDIVTVDCRPFAPVRHVVILEIGDNCTMRVTAPGIQEPSSMDILCPITQESSPLFIAWPHFMGSSRRRNACWKR